MAYLAAVDTAAQVASSYFSVLTGMTIQAGAASMKTAQIFAEPSPLLLRTLKIVT